MNAIGSAKDLASEAIDVVIETMPSENALHAATKVLSVSSHLVIEATTSTLEASRDGLQIASEVISGSLEVAGDIGDAMVEGISALMGALEDLDID